MNIEETQTILSNKGLPVFIDLRELISHVSLPIISKKIIEVEVPWIGTGASALSVPQVDTKSRRQLGLLQQWYVFRGERTGILRFLEKNPFLTPLLIEAYAHIREFFPYSLVYLSIDMDSEEFGADQLDVFISTSLEPDNALDALNAFDKKWWLSSLKRTQGKLCITLEFQ